MRLRAEASPGLVFVAALPDPPGRGTLDPDERHHVVQVLRAVPGDRVRATDGRGALATLRLIETGRAASFEVESLERLPRGAAACIACGVPEGARADWLVEKLAELGVHRFQPLDTAHESWRWSAARARRFERLALAALKQSRQLFRLEVAAPLPLAAWLGGLAEGDLRWLADREGAPVPAGAPPDRPFTGASGPAGGWTEAERTALLEAGFRPVQLAAGVLRAETAGVALAAAWARGAAPARASRP